MCTQRDWLRALSKEGRLSSNGGFTATEAAASAAAPPVDVKLGGNISEAFVRYVSQRFLNCADVFNLSVACFPTRTPCPMRRYMGSYVAWERSEMDEITHSVSDGESMTVLRSSPALFNGVWTFA